MPWLRIVCSRTAIAISSLWCFCKFMVKAFELGRKFYMMKSTAPIQEISPFTLKQFRYRSAGGLCFCKQIHGDGSGHIVNQVVEMRAIGWLWRWLKVGKSCEGESSTAIVLVQTLTLSGYGGHHYLLVSLLSPSSRCFFWAICTLLSMNFAFAPSLPFWSSIIDHLESQAPIATFKLAAALLYEQLSPFRVPITHQWAPSLNFQ